MAPKSPVPDGDRPEQDIHQNQNSNHNTTIVSSSVSSMQFPSSPQREEDPNVRLDTLKQHYMTYQQHTHKTLGTLRMQMELRQLGGFMLVLGIGSAFSTMALICQLIEGMAGRMQMQIEGFLLPLLVGNILQLSCGLAGMMCGFTALLYGGPYPSARFHKWCKRTVAIVNLGGPIAFVITVIRIIQGASDPPELNEFIPIILNPTQMDIRFCAGMGVLVLVSVCASLIGGLTVLGLHMCAIMADQPHSRHRAYHQIRLTYYNLLVLIGGLSQWMLGIYLWARFGHGPYEEPVHVAAYTVHFPIVSVIVGTFQTFMGLYGILFWKLKQHSKDDDSFLYVVAVTWLVTTVLQFVLQPAYSGDAVYDAEGATVASVYLGFFAMPALLDYLARTAPIQPDPEFYGLPEDAYYKEDLPAIWLGMEPKNHKCKTKRECDDEDGLAKEAHCKEQTTSITTTRTRNGFHPEKKHSGLTSEMSDMSFLGTV
jgi:hypothetical protein